MAKSILLFIVKSFDKYTQLNTLCATTKYIIDTKKSILLLNNSSENFILSSLFEQIKSSPTEKITRAHSSAYGCAFSSLFICSHVSILKTILDRT